MMDLANFFCTTVLILFFIAIYFGIAFKLMMLISSLLAFPVYLGFFAVEYFTYDKISQKSSVRFNIPNNNPARFKMNLLATLVTISYGIIGLKIYLKATIKTFMLQFISGEFISLPWSVIPVLFIMGMYHISRNTERDDAVIIDKIENLSISDIWGKLFCKTVGF